MKRLDLINDSTEVVARKLATKMRDSIIVLICATFKDKPVTQKGLAELFGISEAYVSRLLREAREDNHE